MTALPAIRFLTADEDLLDRFRGYLRFVCQVEPVSRAQDLDRALESGADGVVLVDLRGDSRRDLPRWTRQCPHTLFLAFGVPRSDPMLEADSLGLYAAEDLLIDRVRLKTLVVRALDHLAILRENRLLRTEQTAPRATGPLAPPPRASRTDATLPLRHFSRAASHFENVDAMLERIIEGLATAARVSRVGVFASTRTTGLFRLRAGLRCLEDSQALSFPGDAPLVRWFEKNAHLVARSTLELIGRPEDRALLREHMDRLGAEVMVPLHAHGRIIGWLFVGHHSTGLPFDHGDLEDLTIAAEHISTTLENALLYEEVALQKSLAETLIHALPMGVVAVDARGVIRWINAAAQATLELPPGKALDQPAEVLGSRLADLVRRTLGGQAVEVPVEWFDPYTKRTLVVQSRGLGENRGSLGAVVLIQDATEQRALKEKSDQMERTAFWTELAASMSHEIRNPLVAIKTFAQLLPERYADPEFRLEFSRLVADEIERLNGIIDQINAFAHRPEPHFDSLDIRSVLRKGIEQGLPATLRPQVKVTTRWDEDLPRVRGDEHVLSDCITHLIRNAAEALNGRPDAELTLDACRLRNGTPHEYVQVRIQDNGRGIPADIRDKIFSPFCTTKARGMGLGLPIVKRAVVDHDGRMAIDSNDGGTCVTLDLPVAAAEGLS